MRESDLNTTTWYNPDYRSWPSGVGFIHKPSGEEVLISDSECGPKNMEEAKKEIREECLPTEVEYLDGEFWELREEFGKILRKHGVTHVLDVEHHRGPVTLATYLKGFR
jgi:hypothetical protein